MNKVALLIAALAVLAGLWHVFLAKSAESDPYVLSVNAVTNEVDICLDASEILSRMKDSPAHEMGQKLDDHLYQNLGAAILAKHLNQEARARFDIYALILPYSVEITNSPDCEPVTPEPVAPDPATADPVQVGPEVREGGE